MPESSAERVVRTLRNDILTGRYRAGDRLPSERDLVDQVGVNRGAVREGLRSLTQLGIVEIGPGGARVCHIENASLDIVGHLLELSDVPDATLVDQLLEVHSFLFASAVRLATLRASDAQLDEVRVHLQALQAEDLEPAAYLEHIHQMIFGLVEASGNFVLRLLRHGLKVQFWDRIEATQSVELRVPPNLQTTVASQLQDALDERDARQASELVYELMSEHRERVMKMLNEDQAHHLAGRVTNHFHQMFELAPDGSETR